ncbi:MAG: phosphate ABC transporter permease subunit PstC [Tuberibacillus sp.]
MTIHSEKTKDPSRSRRWLLTGIKKYKRDLSARFMIYAVAVFIIIASVSLTLFLILKGVQLFLHDHVNILSMLFGGSWDIHSEKFGALPLIAGSFAVTVLAAIFATPLSIGTALFMVEISKKRGRKWMQPVIEMLVGIPSVVYGFIGLTVLVPFIRDTIGGIGFGLLASMIVVGVMIAPTIISITVDGLLGVDQSLREGSYALGSTRWQTIARVVIPAALPTILSAIVLGMARAFGEALAVQMVIGNTAVFPSSFVNPAATLTTTITSSLGETVEGSTANHALWALGLILLAMSYVFILIIRLIGRKRNA